MTLKYQELLLRATQAMPEYIHCKDKRYIQWKQARQKLGFDVPQRKRGRKEMPPEIRRQREREYQHWYYLNYTKPKRQRKRGEKNAV